MLKVLTIAKSFSLYVLYSGFTGIFFQKKRSFNAIGQFYYKAKRGLETRGSCDQIKVDLTLYNLKLPH